MDLSDPTRALTPTLDGPVLAALARADGPLTVAQVAALVPHGTAAGVRRVIYRLVAQGPLAEHRVGRTSVYEINHEHVAAPVVVELARIWERLWDRVRELVSAWRVQPVSVAVFGSAARRDGDERSDLDLLVVRPDAVAGGDREWEAQIDRLRERGERWSGNPVSILELSLDEAKAAARRRERILGEIEREGIVLVGERAPWKAGGKASA